MTKMLMTAALALLAGVSIARADDEACEATRIGSYTAEALAVCSPEAFARRNCRINYPGFNHEKCLRETAAEFIEKKNAAPPTVIRGGRAQ